MSQHSDDSSVVAPIEPNQCGRDKHLADLLTNRYSCRAFRPDPVSDQVIDTMFRIAQSTASWCNTQPWLVHLLGRETTGRFAEALSAHVSSGATQVVDLGAPSYTGIYAERRRDAGYGLYAALGIERDDYEARSRQALRNFTFFGAPHTAIVTTDSELGTYGAVDCGAYLATAMLAAQSLGLGIITQGAIGMYSDFVRDWLGLPEDRRVVAALSFGYADNTKPVNRFRTTRAPLNLVVRRV